MNKKKLIQVIYIFGGVLTIAGAIMQLMHVMYAAPVFALGTIALIITHLMSAFGVKDDEFRMRRMSRIGLISAFMLLIANYFMLTGSNSWVVFLLIYALVTLFLTFRSE